MGRPALGPREQSSAKQGHPHAGTHLRDEATARHRVEAKLGHILGLGTLSPPACRQKELLFFSSRPERSRAPGQAWAALLGRGWSEDVLHVVAATQHGDRQDPPAPGTLASRAGHKRRREPVLPTHGRHETSHLTISPAHRSIKEDGMQFDLP